MKKLLAALLGFLLWAAPAAADVPAPMPVVRDGAHSFGGSGDLPVEQRGEAFRRWLAASVKISVRGASGSGTIVHYNPEDGYAYVQSCGHLWNGTARPDEGRRPSCKVIVWYHNGRKLDKEQDYPAEALFWSNGSGRDCSLLRFKPDWAPEYFPIAPADFQFRDGMHLHSCGCDGGREVAHYDVRCVGASGPNVATTENSPRPGRSGGGLMTDDYFVGVCWGTTDTSGRGNGFFTPLAAVRECNQKNGFGWLNDAGGWARRIPVVDRNGPQGDYRPDYIPLPSGR